MSRRSVLTISLLGLLAITTPASAKDVTVFVDAHCGPWSQGMNPKLPFGLGNSRAPTMVWGANLLSGTKVSFRASGTTGTFGGAGGPGGTADSFDPDGDQSWPQDRGMSLFPSHYMETKHKPVFLNELVGSFVDADGTVVGKPFGIGKSADIEVPAGAVAIALGINDDNYSDNVGGYHVDIHIPEARVTVEPGSPGQP